MRGQVEELAKSKLEKPKRLGQVAARDWSEISLGLLRFDRHEADVAALRKLTPADLLAFFEVRCGTGSAPDPTTVRVVATCPDIMPATSMCGRSNGCSSLRRQECVRVGQAERPLAKVGLRGKVAQFATQTGQVETLKVAGVLRD